MRQDRGIRFLWVSEDGSISFYRWISTVTYFARAEVVNGGLGEREGVCLHSFSRQFSHFLLHWFRLLFDALRTQPWNFLPRLTPLDDLKVLYCSDDGKIIGKMRCSRWVKEPLYLSDRQPFVDFFSSRRSRHPCNSFCAPTKFVPRSL